MKVVSADIAATIRTDSLKSRKYHLTVQKSAARQRNAWAPQAVCIGSTSIFLIRPICHPPPSPSPPPKPCAIFHLVGGKFCAG